jgi:hypothetical protein
MLDHPVMKLDGETATDADMGDVEEGTDDTEDVQRRIEEAEAVAREPFQGWIQTALDGWPRFVPGTLRGSG